MRIFSPRMVVRACELPWIPTPQPCVVRPCWTVPGGEIARTTMIVRYTPASAVQAHDHALGEEFRVLGCTMFVKLGQMTPSETRRIVMNTANRDWEPAGIDADEQGTHGPGTWIRNPVGWRCSLGSGNGATYRAKRGHPAGAP
jgi:hypothetical protein